MQARFGLGFGWSRFGLGFVFVFGDVFVNGAYGEAEDGLYLLSGATESAEELGELGVVV